MMLGLLIYCYANGIFSSRRIERATHRANFSLMDTPSIVAWIDYIRSGGKHPDVESPVSFQEISYDGRMFLACIEPVWPFHNLLHWPDDFWHDRRSLFRYRRQRMLRRSGKDFAGWFVMEKNAAECFLNALSTIIRDGGKNLPKTLKLPSFEPVGFAIDQDLISPALSKSEYTYWLAPANLTHVQLERTMIPILSGSTDGERDHAGQEIYCRT